jgi:hypothetical protein
VEGRAFAVALHSRVVNKDQVPYVSRVTNDVAAKHAELRGTGGTKTLEWRPCIEWDKSRAVL